MNKTFLINSSFILFFVFTTGLVSCKKSDSGTTGSTGTFYLHLHTNIDTSEVDDTAALYPDASGRHFGLNTAQLYISNIMFHNVNGSMTNVPGAVILKNIDSEQYVIGTVPVGTYDYIMFDVGLNGTTNALAPTAFNNNGYVSNNTMWFGNSTAGYMFVKLIGLADTSTAQNGSGMVPFSYAIGSAANLKTVTLPTRSGTSLQPYILTANNTNFVHLIADYGKLLSGVNFNTQTQTDTYTTNPGLAGSIANNIPNMFSYEE